MLSVWSEVRTMDGDEHEVVRCVDDRVEDAECVPKKRCYHVGVGLGVGTPEGTSQTSRAIAAMGRVLRALIELRRSHGSRNTADSGRGLWTRAPKLLDTNLILPHVASRLAAHCSAVSCFGSVTTRSDTPPSDEPGGCRVRRSALQEAGDMEARACWGK